MSSNKKDVGKNLQNTCFPSIFFICSSLNFKWLGRPFPTTENGKKFTHIVLNPNLTLKRNMSRNDSFSSFFPGDGSV